MSANDYLKSLAAEIVGVSIDKHQLGGDGDTHLIDASGDEPRQTVREAQATGYPARDETEPLVTPPPIAPDRLPD